MIEYFALLLSIPLGILFSKLTIHEKKIFLSPVYFPTMLWLLAFLAAIFLTLNFLVGISLLFTFLTTFVWFIWSRK